MLNTRGGGWSAPLHPRLSAFAASAADLIFHALLLFSFVFCFVFLHHHTLCLTLAVHSVPMPMVCRLCAGLCLLDSLALYRSADADTKYGILLLPRHHPKHARTLRHPHELAPSHPL
jgi:hypothetical protein